jgi:hypothetical protein
MLFRYLLASASVGLFAVGCGGEFQGSPTGTATAASAGSGSGGASTSASGTSTSMSSSASGTGGGVQAPIAIVRATQTKISPVENAPTLTWSTVPAAGNAIIVGITCFSDIDNCTIPPGGVTDNHGNVYQLAVEGSSIISQPTHGARGYIFIAENIATAGNSFIIKVDPNGSVPPNVQNMVWGAIEVSGLASNSLDQIGQFPATGGAITSTTVKTTDATDHANELAVAVHSMRSSDVDVAYTHEPQWTQHHVNANGEGGVNPHSMVSRRLSQTGVASHTWGHDAPTRGVSAVIATFRGK